MDNHFVSEDWADFARHCVRGEDREGMQQHLDEGCISCAGTARLWARVADLAARESSYKPADGDLRLAGALYAAIPPRQGRFEIRLAHLMRPMQTALVGVRAAPGLANHFLFYQKDILFDVHLEAQDPSGVVSMIGQVMDRRSGKRYENRPVSILRRQDPLAQTTTNEFGEFQLRFHPGQDLIVVVELEEQSFLVSPLPNTSE
jgi:hypothetical protein